MINPDIFLQILQAIYGRHYLWRHRASRMTFFALLEKPSLVEKFKWNQMSNQCVNIWGKSLNLRKSVVIQSDFLITLTSLSKVFDNCYFSCIFGIFKVIEHQLSTTTCMKSTGLRLKFSITIHKCRILGFPTNFGVT